jgi:hypothetical protein
MADLIPPGAVPRDTADLIPPGAIPRDPTPKAPQQAPYSDPYGPLTGGILDTLGLTKRPGARTPLDVALSPQGVSEHIARGMMAAPAIYFGGLGAGAAGVPALAGEMAASGLIGAAEAAKEGRSPGAAALTDATVAGLTGGVVPKVLPTITRIPGVQELAKPAQAFKWATEAPKKMLAAIKDRLPKAAFVNVPSLSKSPMNPVDAVKKLTELTGLEYQQARGEIISEFNRLDIQKWLTTATGDFVKGPKPYAGSVFKAGTSKARFEPPTTAKVAEAVRPAAPVARASGEALATDPVAPGVPAGGVAALSFPDYILGAGRALKERIGL